MDQSGLGRPFGQIESIETHDKEIASEKNWNPFEVSEPFSPLKNDVIVTKETLRRETELELGAELRRYINSLSKDKEISKNKEALDEIFQETWITLLDKVEKETIYLSGVIGFACKIAFGKFLNKEKEIKKSNARSEPLDESSQDFDQSSQHLDESNSQDTDYGDILPQRLTALETEVYIKECLKEAFNFLSHREWMVFALTIEGCEDDEIGEQLNISANNVRQIRFRSMPKLHEWMNSWAKQGTFYEKEIGRRCRGGKALQ